MNSRQLRPSVAERVPVPYRQRGAALFLMLAVALVGTGFLLTTLMNRISASQRNALLTAEALARAKEALIGAATTRGSQPGALPCPDVTNDGSSDSSGSICTAYLGRLPWKTLGLPAPRDGSGECLWYALSPVFRTVLAPAFRTAAQKLNDSLPGQITVLDTTGTPLPAPNNPAIAVIFAPGAALPGQDRSSAGSSECGGNTTASNYLDTAAGTDNASGGATVIAANTSDSFNDRLEWITNAQLFTPVNLRVLNTLRGSVADSLGWAYYFKTLSSYPYAATASSAGTAVPSTLSGLVPYANLYAVAAFDATTANWLQNNDWYARVGYAVVPALNSITLSLGSATLVCGSGAAACP